MTIKSVVVRDIEIFLPKKTVSNQELLEENPDWDMKKIEVRAGVLSRHIAEDRETALDLAYVASKTLLSKHPQLLSQIDGLLFCTQSPDYIMPPNSCLLHDKLNLSHNVFALDFNLACSGYIYGLSLAKGLISSGQCRNILLVNADTYSKYIYPKDRSTRTLFGDAATVSFISDSGPGLYVDDIICQTAGNLYDKFYIPAGGARLPFSADTKTVIVDHLGNERSAENIFMDGLGVLKFATKHVPDQIYALLARNEQPLATLDHIFFHQASKLALDKLEVLMGLDPKKVYRCYETIGNCVSASIPLAINDVWRHDVFKHDQRILLSGFGVGLSWASALLRYKSH